MTSFVHLRSPLLPVETFDQWCEGLGAVSAGPLELPAALDRDLAALRARLGTWLERPEVREALFLASGSLHDELQRWRTAPHDKRSRKVELALVRYFSRMCTRATPFGLFATCSLGEVGDETCLELGPASGVTRRTRLDMDYLSSLADALGKDPGVRVTLRYRPSSSLRRAAGAWRWVERRVESESRTYHLVAASPTLYLAAAIERAERGASAAELSASLVSAGRGEVSAAEADAYVTELIAGQLLVSDLAPQVTGGEPALELAQQLDGPAGAVGGTLRQTVEALAALDRAGLGQPPDRYLDVAQQLQPLPAEVNLSRLFQVDATRPSPKLRISRRLLRELSQAAEVLRQLTPPAAEGPLQRFCEAFARRYEEREVPLLEALDEEHGVGFDSTRGVSEPTPLLEGIRVAKEPAPREPSFGARERYLLQRLDGGRELVLGPDDLTALKVEGAPQLPAAHALFVTLLADSPESAARGRGEVFLRHAGGPSGANLLARFCDADEALHARITEHLQAEEATDPGAVFAEVVHLPEGRTGNVIRRPVLRGYEVPFLGRSGAPLERQLPPTDLLVSVRGGRVTLRSKRLGRRVVPRLTNAHAFSRNSLGVYRFLCSLQSQAGGYVKWSWGALADAPFLPRVRIGRTLVSRAQWRLSPRDAASLEGGTVAERFAAVQRLRASRGLPRRVVLVERDNELLLDLENVLCVETLCQEVEAQAVLVEPLLTDAGRCAHGPEGRFVHELVVPVVRAAAPALPAAAPTARARPAQVPRAWLPGSRWLYAKLYCGAASADPIITEHLGPALRALAAEEEVERWFFLRYSDPDWHVRLRLTGAASVLRRSVLPRLLDVAQAAVDAGLAWRVQLDTYVPEVERYGGAEGLALAERVFHADSEAALSLLELLDGDAGSDDARWRLALRGVDALLHDFGLDLPARLQLLGRARESLADEHGGGAVLEDSLSLQFRRRRRGLVDLLGGGESARELSPGLAVLAARAKRLAPMAAELQQLHRDGLLTTTPEAFVTAIIHLSVNRLARSSARLQELVLYDHLYRVYDSRRARGLAS